MFGNISMSKDERQYFIAYRSPADQFEIQFLEGPLDGARILTDIFPDSETFVHRVRDRNYVYRYRRVASHRFHAQLDRFEIPERPQNGTARTAGRALTAAILVFSSVVSAAVVWAWMTRFNQ